MGEDEMIYLLISFILGWIIARMMGEGFSVDYNKMCNTPDMPDGEIHCSASRTNCSMKCQFDRNVADDLNNIWGYKQDGKCVFDRDQGNDKGLWNDIACRDSPLNEFQIEEKGARGTCYDHENFIEANNKDLRPNKDIPFCWWDDLPNPPSPPPLISDGCGGVGGDKEPTDCTKCIDTYCHQDKQKGPNECMQCIVNNRAGALSNACSKDGDQDYKVKGGYWCGVDNICPYLIKEKDCNVNTCLWDSDTNKCVQNLDPCEKFFDSNDCNSREFQKGNVTIKCKWNSKSKSNKCKSVIDPCEFYGSDEPFCLSNSNCEWINKTCKSKTPTPSPTPSPSACFTKLKNLDIPNSPMSECENKIVENINKLVPTCDREEINNYCSDNV